MTTLANSLRAGGFIQSEANYGRSRDEVPMLTGYGVLSAGTVLSMTASGYYVPCVASADDGSQVAVAVLYDQTDTDAEGWNQIAIAVTRAAEVRAEDLTFDASITTLDEQKSKWTQLEAVGIIVRQAGGVQASS
jgi:hypothetical protein